MEALPGLIGIGAIAVVGFLMARSFGGERADRKSGVDAGDTAGSWLTGWFGSSGTASDGASSSSDGSGDSGSGGGDGGGGGD